MQWVEHLSRFNLVSLICFASFDDQEHAIDEDNEGDAYV